MRSNRLLKVFALVLVLALAVTAPLGCAKKPVEDPGGDAGGGGALVGDDPSKGETLGAWGQGWSAGFAVGQHFRYNMVTYDETEGVSTGCYELWIKDTGHGQYMVEWFLELPGVYFNNYFGTDPGEIDWELGMDSKAWDLVRGLIETPGLMIGMSGLDNWEEGTCSGGEGDDVLTCTISGKRSFAGVTGAWGRWDTGDGSFGEFCVNPNVPLALYVRTGNPGSWLEYELTAIDGF